MILVSEISNLNCKRSIVHIFWNKGTFHLNCKFDAVTNEIILFMITNMYIIRMNFVHAFAGIYVMREITKTSKRDGRKA
jgi:hypothetical protein